MKNKILFYTRLLPVSLLFLSNIALAQPATTNLKTSVKLSALCTISATNVVFGTLMMPLSAQGSSGSMKVLCSREAPYTISLAYGGVYGTGGGSGEYYVFGYMNTTTWAYTMTYNRYSAEGAFLGTQDFAAGNAVNDRYGLIATRLGCDLSADRRTCSLGSPSYDYGKMMGLGKGDSVGYTITVPNNPSLTWNSGKGSYTSAGTGEIEDIPITAKIVPAQSSSAYPAADTYMDTVTATISY